jgi:hypothetical protein
LANSSECEGDASVEIDNGRDKMSPAETYRANAAVQRQAAAKTNLQNRREMHERSAEAWEVMAAANDDTVAKAAVNAAAKRA